MPIDSGPVSPPMAPLLVSRSVVSFDDPITSWSSVNSMDARSPRSRTAKTSGQSSKNGSHTSGESNGGGNTSNFAIRKTPPGGGSGGSGGGANGSTTGNKNGSNDQGTGSTGSKASGSTSPTNTETPHSGKHKPSRKVVGGGMSVGHVCDVVVLTAFVTSHWRSHCRLSCDRHPYLDLEAPPKTPRWRVKPRP